MNTSSIYIGLALNSVELNKQGKSSAQVKIKTPLYKTNSVKKMQLQHIVSHISTLFLPSSFLAVQFPPQILFNLAINLLVYNLVQQIPPGGHHVSAGLLALAQGRRAAIQTIVQWVK